ncbi:MAG: hypothetical protein ACYDBJ_25365 [Aggregatilineales bacterium]
MGYEIEAIHPIMAQWLKDHAYEYLHEVKLREFGRADFVATALDGSVLIIDCKTSLGTSTGRYCVQVIDYCTQYGHGSKPALAAPKDKIGVKARQIAEKRNVTLIELDMEGVAYPRKSVDLDKLIREHFLKGLVECGDLHRCLNHSEDVSDTFRYKSYRRVFVAGIHYILSTMPLYIQKGLDYSKARQEILSTLNGYFGFPSDDTVLIFFKAVDDLWKINHLTGQHAEYPLRESSRYVP